MGIIIKPLVTEKMTAITDKLNRFGFIAPLRVRLMVLLAACTRVVFPVVVLVAAPWVSPVCLLRRVA